LPAIESLKRHTGEEQELHIENEYIISCIKCPCQLKRTDAQEK